MAIAVAILLSGRASLAALPEPLLAGIEAELEQAITLHLENGQQLRGHAVEVNSTQLKLASAEGSGEIIYTFDSEAIARIEVPGESYKTLALEWMQAGRQTDALELMDRLYAQRVNLIPLLPPAESHFFVYYVHLILRSPQPARAIGVSDRIKPQIANEDAIHKLEDDVLDSYYILQLYAAAKPLARDWVRERKPYDSSALGYFVLGMEHLRSGEPEAALELALRPIVFAAPSPQDKLPDCYALAIGAALQLRDVPYAKRLYREMEARSLVWPKDNPELGPILNAIQQHLKKDEDSTPSQT